MERQSHRVNPGDLFSLPQSLLSKSHTSHVGNAHPGQAELLLICKSIQRFAYRFMFSQARGLDYATWLDWHRLCLYDYHEQRSMSQTYRRT